VANETTDGRVVRAEHMRGQRRAEILHAAEAVFSELGYHSTSVADVIDAAGISRGTFYLYFAGKDALFLDLIDLFVSRVIAVVTQVDPKDPAALDQIYDNLHRVVDVVFDNRHLALLVIREQVGRDEALDEKLNRLYGFLHEMVEGALSKGARHQLIRQVNEAIVATAIIGAVKQVFYRHLVVDRVESADREAVAKSLFEFGFRGLLIDR